MRVRSGSPGGPAPPAPPGSRPPGEAHRGRTFVAVLADHGVATPAQSPPAPPAKAPPDPRPKPTANVAGAPAGPVHGLLARALDGERRVDALLAAAARGKTFSPSELFALQATVFRYSQAVEVVSRATDKLIGAVKQTMSTQV